jgi:hypothetical protein
MAVLPQITISDVKFYVDFRLEEIRPVNAPFLCMYFDDLDEEFKKKIRGIRAERGPNAYIKSIDEWPKHRDPVDNF